MSDFPALEAWDALRRRRREGMYAPLRKPNAGRRAVTEGYRPQDGPDEPQQVPPGRGSASLPPDPFSPMDAGGVTVMATFRALRRAGASLIEAALIVAANLAFNGLIGEAKNQQQDGHG